MFSRQKYIEAAILFRDLSMRAYVSRPRRRILLMFSLFLLWSTCTLYDVISISVYIVDQVISSVTVVWFSNMSAIFTTYLQSYAVKIECVSYATFMA